MASEEGDDSDLEDVVEVDAVGVCRQAGPRGVRLTPAEAMATLNKLKATGRAAWWSNMDPVLEKKGARARKDSKPSQSERKASCQQQQQQQQW